MQAEFFPETLLFSFSPTREKGHDIYPVFLPFSGCPGRCLFCAQDIQTGRAPAPVLRHLDNAAEALEKRLEQGLPALELAFFGGTFTALPPEELQACLDFAIFWRKKGALLSFRCSTRPDRLDRPLLEALKTAGCAMVELGVQSFSDPALARSQRGYTGARAQAGCRMVKESGLRLGIQLMPGIPGLEPEAARRDIDVTLALAPDCVRLYPCLVLAGAPLADCWRAGRYVPWNLPDCVDFLARACLRFEQTGIAVVRMGVAEEPGLAEQVLAGPRHPALGNMVRALALHLYLHERMREFEAAFPGVRPGLFAPRRFQGEFWGHRKELAPAYAALGLTKETVRWWEHDCFALAGPRGIAMRAGTRYSETWRTY